MFLWFTSTIILTHQRTIVKFLWSDVKESRKIAAEKKQEISEELADIFIFSLLFAHETGIDMETAIQEKIKLNDKKYPVEKARGTSKKYKEL